MDRYLKLIAVVLLVGVAVAQDAIDNTTPIPAKDRIAETKTEHDKRMMKTVDARISQAKYSWRCCHKDGKMVLIPFFANGETWTPYDMIETETLDLLKAEVIKLGITMTEAQKVEYDKLKAVPEK